MSLHREGCRGPGQAARGSGGGPIPGGVESRVDAALGDVVSGGLGSAGWMVGLHDLKGLFQPQCFYDFGEVCACVSLRPAASPPPKAVLPGGVGFSRGCPFLHPPQPQILPGSAGLEKATNPEGGGCETPQALGAAPFPRGLGVGPAGPHSWGCRLASLLLSKPRDWWGDVSAFHCVLQKQNPNPPCNFKLLRCDVCTKLSFFFCTGITLEADGFIPRAAAGQGEGAGPG